VIVCSILSDQGKGFSLGAADYLVKPITEDDLLRALKRLDGRKRTTVLIIDDTPEDVRLIRRILETPRAQSGTTGGYVIGEAHSGAEGIAAVYEHPPDLIVLDLMMPGVDGFTVLEALKADPATRPIPIIVVTAKELSDQDRQRLNGYTEALLSKGLFSEQELLADVMVALKETLDEAGPDARRPTG
jgi:CheY-like chemotaxis protein